MLHLSTIFSFRFPLSPVVSGNVWLVHPLVTASWRKKEFNNILNDAFKADIFRKNYLNSHRTYSNPSLPGRRKKKKNHSNRFDKEIAFSCISISFSVFFVEESWSWVNESKTELKLIHSGWFKVG